MAAELLSRMSPDMQLASKLGWRMGRVMRHYFDAEYLESEDKPDGSPVTDADKRLSKLTIRALRMFNTPVVSEEGGGTANYGNPNAAYTDPLDGTKDFKLGRNRTPRLSIAGYSLGQAENGRFVRGVVNFPLIDSPRQYLAEEGVGSFRVMEPDGILTGIKVDPELAEGVILVSRKHPQFHTAINAQPGLRAVAAEGAVWKGCAVADPELMMFDPVVSLEEGEPVLGFLSDSTQPHDNAAAAAIVEGAGDIAWGLERPFAPLSLEEGKNGCIMANNPEIGEFLWKVAQLL